LPRRYLSAVEAKKLLDTPFNTPIGRRDRLILRLLLGSGLRRAEALALRPKHLNMVDGMLTVIDGKGGKDRVVPIDRVLIRDLLEYAEHYRIGMDDRLFPYSMGWLSRLVKKYGERAGLKGVHTHALRHTYAVHSIKEGRDPATIQGDLGHKSIKTTGIYFALYPHDRSLEHQAKPLPWEKKEQERE